MYTLNEEQIGFIEADLKARGLTMEDLQQNLLDHICCIIENEMGADETFDTFYQQTIRRFYKKELTELEEETQLLLTFKNYYAMKKVMITSGVVSAAAFVLGSFFKLMHWPGASVLLVLGMLISGMVFLPLLLVLKNQETRQKQDKAILSIGIVIAILFCFSTMFKLQHWPGAHVMWLSTLGLFFIVFVPVYFFTGIRNPETKANTIVSTVLLVFAGALLFSLTSLKPGRYLTDIRIYTYIQNEELLHAVKGKAGNASTVSDAREEIDQLCNELKKLVLHHEPEPLSLKQDFESGRWFMDDVNLGGSFNNGPGSQLLSNLKTAVLKYNASASQQKIPVDHALLSLEFDQVGSYYNNLLLLENLTTLQMYLAAERLRN